MMNTTFLPSFYLKVMTKSQMSIIRLRLATYFLISINSLVRARVYSLRATRVLSPIDTSTFRLIYRVLSTLSEIRRLSAHHTLYNFKVFFIGPQIAKIKNTKINASSLTIIGLFT